MELLGIISAITGIVIHIRESIRRRNEARERQRRVKAAIVAAGFLVIAWTLLKK